MSIRTFQFACHLPSDVADDLNAESARIYNAVMIEHWRIYRRHGIWLRQGDAEKLNDCYDSNIPSTLHAHSIDAAQQGFYKACKTTHALRHQGDETVRFPYWRKNYRTTVWKNTGVYEIENGVMQLSLARGLERLRVRLPSHLGWLNKAQTKEVRLVFDVASRRYIWHVVVDDGIEPEPFGEFVAGVDLGEIHPAAITDGREACVVSCRELRALNQYRNKRIASIDAQLTRYRRGSRRWRRLRARKARFLTQCDHKQRDMEHKIAREVISWAQKHRVGLIAIGDVRDIADGKGLGRVSQQKIANWSHGTIRTYIKYKAAEAGIQVNDKVSERYTSQTCPACGQRHKPRGRIFTCPHCGRQFHRDVVGAANILSRYEFHELGRYAAPEPKYRHPVDVRGKRSPADTGELARSGENRVRLEEAAGF
ncbi:MAG: transposase [Anaerolineae bacterium]|nr:transposase [Anaerolineae bacterium]